MKDFEIEIIANTCRKSLRKVISSVKLNSWAKIFSNKPKDQQITLKVRRAYTHGMKLCSIALDVVPCTGKIIQTSPRCFWKR